MRHRVLWIGLCQFTGVDLCVKEPFCITNHRPYDLSAAQQGELVLLHCNVVILKQQVNIEHCKIQGTLTPK
jgi:hypothetical protein